MNTGPNTQHQDFLREVFIREVWREGNKAGVDCPSSEAGGSNNSVKAWLWIRESKFYRSLLRFSLVPWTLFPRTSASLSVSGAAEMEKKMQWNLGDEVMVGFKMKNQYTQNWLRRGSDSSRKHTVEPFVCLIMNRNADVPQSCRVTKLGWRKVSLCRNLYIHISPSKTSIKMPTGNQN